MPNDKTLVMGAVAYDPKVITIWDGFQRYFSDNGLAFDYVLYSNYERQVEAHVMGDIDVAWNSPLAWLQTERVANTLGKKTRAVCMRDTDRDLTSVIIVRNDSPIERLEQLNGTRVGVGAQDSPQATLIPLHHLLSNGLMPNKDFTVVGFEVGFGKHGDHIGGERDAVLALLDSRVDAACLIDSNLLAFNQEGMFKPGTVRVLSRTTTYDHCNFTVLDNGPLDLIERLKTLLLSMSYADAKVRPLLDLEGLKAWKPGRTDGYHPLKTAIESFGTIDSFTKRLSARCM
jgi:phosphonate transport system substrate-binding protein